MKRIIKRLRKKINSKNMGFLFVLPGFLGLSIFYIIPIGDVLRRSFLSVGTGNWQGFNNYITILNNNAFRLATYNTLRFLLVSIPILLVVSLLPALYFNCYTGVRNVMKSAYLLPMAVPVAATAVVWKLLFDYNGILNGIFSFFGIEPLQWLQSDYTFGVLIFCYIWKNMGYCIILWLVGLSTIPQILYEAAKTDGAGKVKTFFYITFPNLRHNLQIILIISIINALKIFREAYLLVGDYPHDSIYMMQHVFNNWFRNLEINKMAAGAILNFIVILLVVIFIKKMGDEAGA